MQLEHRFTVPVPPDVAWAALLDPERVTPCFPGATLQSVDGQEFTGTVKVRLGPISLLYKGKGAFADTDEQARRTVIQAAGKDSRGNGTASANVAVQVSEEGAGTAVELITDLTVTGRPAQLGRGLIADVSGKIVAKFADCLAKRLAGSDTNPGPEAASAPVPAVEPAPPAKPISAAGPAASAERAAPGDPAGSAPSEINLIEVAGVPVLKRLLPLLLSLVVVLFVVRRLTRRR